MSDTGRRRGEAARVLTPRRIVAAVLATLAVIVVLQNRAEVTLQFLAFQITAALWVASLALLVIGVLVGVLVSARRGRA